MKWLVMILLGVVLVLAAGCQSTASTDSGQSVPEIIQEDTTIW